MTDFIAYIKTYVSLSKEAEQRIKEFGKTEDIAKGVQLLEFGRTCKRLYFLEKGTVRTFFYLNGKDITHWIYPEGVMFTSWSSYLFNKPSTEYIETTQDATLISFHLDEIQELYSRFPEVERFGRLIMEEQIGLMDDYFKGYYFLSAKEKYQLLIRVMPNITQKANLGHIASMLGISQETLSRIRGK